MLPTRETWPTRTSGERAWVAPSRRDRQTQFENLCYGGTLSQASRWTARMAVTTVVAAAMR
jgi:hypothetical protein